MAQTPYSTKLLQAYSGIETLKDALRSIKDTSSEPYKNLLAQLKQANIDYAALQKQEDTWKQSQTKGKNLDQAKELQRELDIANAGGDTAEAKRLTDQITKLGGTPLDVNGQPITVAAPTPTPTPKPDTTTKGLLIPPGYKVVGKNVVDNTNKVVGTTTDGKTYTQATPTPTPKPGANPPSTGGPTLSNDTKTVWVNYLKQAFATIDDPTAKAQIDAIFKQASAPNSGWTETTFMQALDQVPWWQKMQPSLKQFFLETHDPRQQGVLDQQLQNKTDTILANLGQLGVKLNDVDPVTGKIIDNTPLVKGVALDAIKNGWSDQQIQQNLAKNHQVIFTGGGSIGAYSTQIQNQAGLYGINLDSTQKAAINGDLMDPTSGRDYTYWMNEVKNQAMRQYAPFSKDIQEGRTLYQATSNYRQQMANLLEVDPANITWNDLMKGVIDTNTGNVRTQNDFIKQVKSNPLWQTTQNAKETYTNLGENLMREFGFIG